MVRTITAAPYAVGLAVADSELGEIGTAWEGEVCGRCSRRNVVGFLVTNEVWERVVRERWGVLCTTCFDEEAEAAGVSYSFVELSPVTWAEWLTECRGRRARPRRACRGQTP